MKAGRELDALVAVRVMGMTNIRALPDFGGPYGARMGNG